MMDLRVLKKQPKSQPYDYYLILDFEAVCDKDYKTWEIIEFPTVLFNPKNLKIEGEFREYVKPVIYPNLNPVCIQITGIQPEWCQKGPSFQETLALHHLWMQKMKLIDEKEQLDLSKKQPPIHFLKGKKFIFVTCGDWDLKKMITHQCAREKIHVPCECFYYSLSLSI